MSNFVEAFDTLPDFGPLLIVLFPFIVCAFVVVLKEIDRD